MGEWETEGHRCWIIRGNGAGVKAWNDMDEKERADMMFDLHATCCHGRARVAPKRTRRGRTVGEIMRDKGIEEAQSVRVAGSLTPRQAIAALRIKLD